jgi:hypothetical protein
MINFRLLLGLFPKTESYEAKAKALWKEFEEFKQYNGSEELKHYLELEKYIGSAEFSNKVSGIKGEKFTSAEEYRLEQEYTNLKKSARFKTYLKVKASRELADFYAFEKSPELARMGELEKSQEEDARKELEKLRKSGVVKRFNKFKESEKYRTFYEVDQSELPEKYLQLEEKVHGEDFRKRKEYLLLSPDKKFKLSEEFRNQEEYLTLKKSEKVKWYYACEKVDKFRELKKLTLNFEEDFTENKLDTGKWITRYFFGDKILGAAYSLSSEQQFLTDGKNLEVGNSELKIHTRKEDIRGMAWDPLLGFFPKDFSFTSGTVNTGKSFRQQYGIFEAKVKLNNPGKVTHAFWLSGDGILPQIDVLKTDNNKLLLSNFWGNPAEKEGIRKKTFSLSASKLMGDYFIFSLEWSPSAITWKVNGLVLATQNEGIPAIPLFVNFSSGIYKDSVNGSVPASMAIDWVKVYTRAE